MKKLIALILALTMAFGVAVPALAAEDPTDTQTEITQTDTDDPETPENPEEPETPEQPENPEEPETPEQPENPEEPEQPENPEEPEQPIEEEKLGYFESLLGCIVLGVSMIFQALPMFPMILLFPVLAIIPPLGAVALASPVMAVGMMVLGVGELALSPIIAALVTIFA